MQLIWYGHSCFLLKTYKGKRILTDPFGNTIGYNNNFPKCDLITISHFHFEHSYLKNIDNTTKIINETGLFDMKFLTVEGIPTFHDKCNGLKRGPNIIYLFNVDGYKICHLGDLGHIPCDFILEKLRNLDILLIPIGGHFSLDGLEASELCKLILPKYIIPMHYKTYETSLYLEDSKKFITSMKYIKKLNTNIFDTSDFTLNNKSQTILLTPPHN